jgi:hypothetical protein
MARQTLKSEDFATFSSEQRDDVNELATDYDFRYKIG